MYLVCPYASDGGQIPVIISRTFACVRSGDGLQLRVVEDVVPAFIKQRELYTKVMLGYSFLNWAKAEIGFAYGRLNDYYLQSSNVSFPDARFDHNRYDLFCGSLRIEQNSLDNKLYPVSGEKLTLTAQYVTGKEHYTPASEQLQDYFESQTQSWLQMKAH